MQYDPSPFSLVSVYLIDYAFQSQKIQYDVWSLCRDESVKFYFCGFIKSRWFSSINLWMKPQYTIECSVVKPAWYRSGKKDPVVSRQHQTHCHASPWTGLNQYTWDILLRVENMEVWIYTQTNKKKITALNICDVSSVWFECSPAVP